MTCEQSRDPDAALAENLRLSRVEAPVYDRNHFEIFHPWEQRRVQREMARLGRGARCALDVGAGTGNVVSKIPPCVTRVGADLSDDMLRGLRERDPRVHTVRTEASALPFVSQSFDLVTCYSTLHHLAYGQASLEEMCRVLAPGGTLVLDHEWAFQEAGWRARLYGVLSATLRGWARIWYWWRPGARPFVPYRRVHWPLSETFGNIDFSLTEGGRVDPLEIGAKLRHLGLRTWRSHYLLEPLPMQSTSQAVVDALCRRLKMGHYFIAGRRPS